MAGQRGWASLASRHAGPSQTTKALRLIVCQAFSYCTPTPGPRRRHLRAPHNASPTHTHGLATLLHHHVVQVPVPDALPQHLTLAPNPPPLALTAAA